MLVWIIYAFLKECAGLRVNKWSRASVVLDKLRDCANVPPNYSDCHYLKKTKIWKSSYDVQQWLNNNWLSCPKVLMHYTYVCAHVLACMDFYIAYIAQHLFIMVLFSFGLVLTEIKHITQLSTLQSQNKLLKYSYLPRRKHLTLSQLAVVLYEEFIPDMHHKYIYCNYHMLPTYRK